MSPAILAKLENPTAAWNLNVTSARRAADRASHVASVCSNWASRAGLAREQAAEAVRAAEAARMAADRAATATSVQEMREEAALAAEALELALAADKRVSEIITAQLWAA